VRPNTARLAGEFTAALLHMGPGPHPDGSPQAVHGGGMPHQAPPAPSAQMAFDFASPAPAKAPARPKPAGPDTTAIIDRLLAQYPEAPEADDAGIMDKSSAGWLTPDGRLIDISASNKMHAEVALEGLDPGATWRTDRDLSRAQERFEALGFVRLDKIGPSLGFSTIAPLTKATRTRVEHIFDMARPKEWGFDLNNLGSREVGWYVRSYEDNAAEKLRAKTGIDIRGLYETALARRRKQLCLS
jgi:hypothetical protein